MAEELREYEQARSHYLTALEIFVEFNDNHNKEIVLRSLHRLFQTIQDDSLLTDITQRLSSDIEEVTQQFNRIREQS